MTPDSTSDAKKIYRAGDRITAKLKLKPGHDLPTYTSATLTRTPAPTNTFDPNRMFTIGLSSMMGMMPGQSTAPAPPDVIALAGVIPHHIIGGTYKPTAVSFTIPNEPNQFDNNPDPNGDFVLEVEDDQPQPIDKPVIEDFDLA